MDKKTKYLLVFLGVLYLCIFIPLSIAPAYRAAWWMENATVWVIIAAVAVALRKGYYLSKTSYIIVFAGVVSQTVGGYYTFQDVPLGHWLASLFNLSRNHYDHIGHFLCGCFAYPVADFLCLTKIAHTAKLSALFSISFMMMIASLYEIWEWASIIFTEEVTRLTYVGAQGEEWDTEIDMFCCLCGAILSAAIFAYVSKRKNLYRMRRA